MKDHWHGQIQRYADGQASAEEAALLQAALNEDAELRASYLDYMNLDVALSAAAEAATFGENGIDRIATFPRAASRSSPHYGRWLAAAAACAALLVFVMLPKHRDSSRARQDIAAATASSRAAISRLRAEVPPALPEWMSPTASLLNEPVFPQ